MHNNSVLFSKKFQLLIKFLNLYYTIIQVNFVFSTRIIVQGRLNYLLQGGSIFHPGWLQQFGEGLTLLYHNDLANLIFAQFEKLTSIPTMI